MSSTNFPEDDSIKKPHGQTHDEDSSQQQSTSSGVRAGVNIKTIILSATTEEPCISSDPLSCLEKLDIQLLKEQFYDNTKEVGKTKSEIIVKDNNKDLFDKLITKVGTSAHFLYKSPEGFEAREGTSKEKAETLSRCGSDVTLNSLEGLDHLLLIENAEIEEDESFVTIEACQKEKTTSTDIPTVFSPNDRTQQIILARAAPMNQPPPPYEYPSQTAGYRSQGPQYQGQINQTPVYSQQYGYGMDVPQDASAAPPYRRNYYNDTEELFNLKQIRNHFVKKVYAILSVQLLFTFGCIAFCIYEKNAREFVTRQWPLLIASMIAYLILAMTLFCYEAARRTFPLNFILLFLLTLVMAYMTAAISCYYSTYIVMAAMGVTAGICTLISLLACQHWFDVTECGMMLCVATIIIMIYGVIAIIVTLLTGSKIFYLIYACLITLVFCGYLMYDTQQILGGRRIELSPEEYILGALTLYVDIMIIFQKILWISGYICGN